MSFCLDEIEGRALLDDATIENLRRAVAALGKPANSATAWEALEPLAGLARSDLALTIDVAASRTVGAPVVLARPMPAHNDPFAGLTPRQNEVALLAATGLSNKAIARELGISLATVKDHVHAALSRLELSSRAQLAAAARPVSPKG